MVIDTVASLLSDAVIYNKPNKQGGESLYVSKMNAEALSIIETDEEEEEEMDKTRPQQTQNKKGGKTKSSFHKRFTLDGKFCWDTNRYNLVYWKGYPTNSNHRNYSPGHSHLARTG